MKRNLLLFGLLLTVASNIVAQEPIAMEGKEWNVQLKQSGREESDYVNGQYTRNKQIWIDGDTIVDGIPCKKLYILGTNVWDGNIYQESLGYCRQDGEKYYQNGKLMFDFSLQVNDKFGDLVVKEIGDTVLSDGVSRKYLLMADVSAYDPLIIYDMDYWVEGIGSLTAGVLTNYPFGDGSHITLLDCSHNNQYLYKSIEAGVEEPLYKPTTATPYYDLQGRKVAHPTRGIYIKDGRKVVIK